MAGLVRGGTASRPQDAQVRLRKRWKARQRAVFILGLDPAFLFNCSLSQCQVTGKQTASPGLQELPQALPRKIAGNGKEQSSWQSGSQVDFSSSSRSHKLTSSPGSLVQHFLEGPILWLSSCLSHVLSGSCGRTGRTPYTHVAPRACMCAGQLRPVCSQDSVWMKKTHRGTAW